MIAVKTEKRTRFGITIDVEGKKVKVNSEGVALVPPEFVGKVLLYGFELVDKDAAYASLEDQKAAKEANEILENAKLQANQIIEKAQKEAEKIIKAAEEKTKAQEGNLKEKQQVTDELKNMTVVQLKDELKNMGVSEEEYKSLSKELLVELVYNKTFPEN